MARPCELTPALIGLVTAEIEKGNYPEIAARVAGIARSTYYAWLERGRADAAAGLDTLHRQFSDAVKEAEAQAESLLLGELKEGPLGWQARAWILERRWRGRWAREPVSAEEKALRLREQRARTELAELQLGQARRMAGEDSANPAEGYADPLRSGVETADPHPAPTRGGGDDRPER